MEPFDADRGSADLTGASRLDRLRAGSGSAAPPPAPSRPVLPWLLAAVLLAFVLGMLANPWFEASVRSRLPGFAPTLAPTVAELTALQARVAALESRPAVALPALTSPATPGSGDERLARVETRLDGLAASEPATADRTERLATELAALTGRIDATQAATAAALATATSNAERAQAMLVLAKTRRQLEAGVRLGALEPALRRAFAAGAPAGAVEAVATLGSAPMTPAMLRGALERLRGALTGDATPSGTPRGWWQGLKDSLSGIVVRTGGATANDPAGRVDRAVAALAASNVTSAMAEIDALPAPTRARAQSWLAAASRYQAGMRGLATLEAAMLEPLPPAPILPVP